MPIFRIEYNDPKLDVLLTKVVSFEDSPAEITEEGFKIPPTSALEWAEDLGYSLADKGWYSCVELPSNNAHNEVDKKKENFMSDFNLPSVMSANDLAGALEQSQVQETSQVGGVSFLKIDFETGEWLLGQDAEEVTGEEILVNTSSIQHGWILWSGGRPQKAMVSFVQPLPPAMAGVGTDMPSEARAFGGGMIDNGDPVQFDTSSYGGRKGADKLLSEIKAHSAGGSQYLYPKCELSSESYTNKARGGKLVYNPVFKVVAWCDAEGNEEPDAAAQIEKPKRASRKAAAEPEAAEEEVEEEVEEVEEEEVVEEEVVEEAPKRQRRKRKASK